MEFPTREHIVVNYEVSSTARILENSLGVSWSLINNRPLENLFLLRYTSHGIDRLSEDLVIDKVPVVIGTGLYIQLLDPSSVINIKNYNQILRRKNIGVLNSPSNYDYNHRGEITLILYNYGVTPQTIKPGDVVATISFELPPRPVLTRVTAIYDNENKNKIDNEWVSQDRRDVKQTIRPAQQSKDLSNIEIQNIIKDRNK
jgi:dUTPase